jgi:hypothetical protein
LESKHYIAGIGWHPVPSSLSAGALGHQRTSNIYYTNTC